MLKLADLLDEKCSSVDLSKIDTKRFYIFVSVKHNIFGVSLKDSFLLVHHKYLYSFRAKLQNLSGLLPAFLREIRCKDENIANHYRESLEVYFSENHDNPYAVQHTMNSIGAGKHLDDLTQYPPLFFDKDAQKHTVGLENMKSLAKPGDEVFTYNRGSGISSLIRKYDQGMWSHCGIVDINKQIFEMTTTGLRVSDFSDLSNPSIDIGLYRPKKNLTEENIKDMQDSIDSIIKRNHRFNWNGLLRVFLHRKFKIPLRHGYSPQDLMYSNILQLVTYC